MNQFRYLDDVLILSVLVVFQFESPHVWVSLSPGFFPKITVLVMNSSLDSHEFSHQITFAPKNVT